MGWRENGNKKKGNEFSITCVRDITSQTGEITGIIPNKK